MATLATATFTVLPSVTSINPTSGPASGGTVVTITGTGFSTTSGATTIKFGSTSASTLSCSSTTSCTATSPSGSGTVDVTVSVGGQTSATSAADRFAYVSTAADGSGTLTTTTTSVANGSTGNTIVFTYTAATGGTSKHNDRRCNPTQHLLHHRWRLPDRDQLRRYVRRRHGSKSNFGFNVKFNKGGTNLQGNVNIIIRAGGHVYQIKSNSMMSLGETPSPCAQATTTSPCTANFVSKANLTDITNPNTTVSLGGNLTLQMLMTDFGTATKDTIGFTLYDASNKLLFSSNWNTTKTVEQTLGGGNLAVH